MRVRILKRPVGPVNESALDGFEPGRTYDVDPPLAEVLLAENWAEPVRDAPPQPTTSSSIVPHAVVLVIDDDVELRGSIAALLRANGYIVVLAGHGRDGLERLCDQRPDVILLDLNMPVMDGWEFRAEQERLADKGLASVPVLLCTAALDAEMHAADLGAAALIEKPVDMDLVLQAVRTVVGPTSA